MIREATPDDTAILSEIIRRSFRDVADRFGLTPENCPTHPSNCEPGWITHALDSGARYYLLAQNEVPCGCVALRDGDDGVTQLERLAILSEYRCMGFGKALVEHATAIAASEGRSRIDIAIIAEHADLRRWYEHLGFHEACTRHFDQLPFGVTFMTRVLSHST